jgi:hypothetical protein
LPAHEKPLSKLSSSHRKRAQKRRRHWKAIEAATVETQPRKDIAPSRDAVIGMATQGHEDNRPAN